ncbi:MAG: caspase family protein [Arcobacteraceae bacterium]|nr:caspase family protein [Arcobacteraceae bacterium]
MKYLIISCIIYVNLFGISLCESKISDKSLQKVFNSLPRKDVELSYKILEEKFHSEKIYKGYYASILFGMSKKDDKKAKYWLKKTFENASNGVEIFMIIVGTYEFQEPSNYKKLIKDYIQQSNFLLEKEKIFLLAVLNVNKDMKAYEDYKQQLLQASQMGCGTATFSLADYFESYKFELPKEFLKIAKPVSIDLPNNTSSVVLPDKQSFEAPKKAKDIDFPKEFFDKLENERYSYEFDENDLVDIRSRLENKQAKLKDDKLYLYNFDFFSKQYPTLFKTKFYLENDISKQEEILKKYLLTISPKATKKDIDNFLGFILKYKYYYHYLHFAAEQGDVLAQYRLGGEYQNYSFDSFGQLLIKEDKKKALYWNEKAAFGEEKGAMKQLAIFYGMSEFDKDIQYKDNTKALYWYKKYGEYSGDYQRMGVFIFDSGFYKNNIKVAKYYLKKAMDYTKSLGVDLDTYKEWYIDKYNLLNISDPTEKEIVEFDALIDSYGSDEAKRAFNEYQITNDDIPNILANMKPKQTNPKNWLIAIGTEKYDNTDEIKYSKNSTDGFVKVAQKTLGISERNTYSLIEEKSTSGAIKDNLEMLLKNVKDGDTIYFYYSGHGIPVLPDNEPYILPKDKMPEMIGKDDFFKLRNIYKMLSDSKAKKVVAIVDSCFSGATNGVSIIKGVAATRIIPKKVTFDTNKMVVLTAGQDKQYSNMYEEKGHRLFSYFVMKSLLKGKTDAKDIYRDVYTNVKDESFKMGDLKVQEPTMEGNENIQF